MNSEWDKIRVWRIQPLSMDSDINKFFKLKCYSPLNLSIQCITNPDGVTSIYLDFLTETAENHTITIEETFGCPPFKLFIKENAKSGVLKFNYICSKNSSNKIYLDSKKNQMVSLKIYNFSCSDSVFMFQPLGTLNLNIVKDFGEIINKNRISFLNVSNNTSITITSSIEALNTIDFSKISNKIRIINITDLYNCESLEQNLKNIHILENLATTGSLPRTFRSHFINMLNSKVETNKLDSTDLGIDNSPTSTDNKNAIGFDEQEQVDIAYESIVRLIRDSINDGSLKNIVRSTINSINESKKE